MHVGSTHGQPQLPDSSHKRVPAGGWPQSDTSTHTTHYAAEKGNHETPVSAEQSTERTTTKDHAQPGHVHEATATEDRATATGTDVPGVGYSGIYMTTHGCGQSPPWTRNTRSFPQVSHTSGPWLKGRAGRNGHRVGLPKAEVRGPERGCGPAGADRPHPHRPRPFVNALFVIKTGFG